MTQSKKNHSFQDLDLHPTVLKAVREVGFEIPSPIQQAVIPDILAGKDLIAQAQTGSGKTAAFCLPALHFLYNSPDAEVLVITPTRELAIQVCDELTRFSKYSNISPIALYGGQPISKQLHKIRNVRAIVATPGRLLDLLRSKRLSHFQPSLVILDEADEMLNMGFLEDVQAIFAFLPLDRQTLLFSATMPKQIEKLALSILKQPVFIKAAIEKNHQDIQQLFYIAKEKGREHALIRLLETYSPFKSLIFCNTKKQVDELSIFLNRMGYPTLSLHGDMEQRQRQNTIEAFKQEQGKCLVATDVAGRGLNIVDISHVFNYQLPNSPESYTHRIGRTGRAGQKGTAISLISPTEIGYAKRIIRAEAKKLTFLSLPSNHEVKQHQQQNFIGKIKQQAIHNDAEDILTLLQREMDLKQIGLHLISIYCEKQKNAIPEYSKKALEV